MVQKRKLYFGRPKDKSFEAFKEWIDDVSEHLGAEDDITDEQLRKDWVEFWKKSK